MRARRRAVNGGYNIIILSDRMVGPDRIPIPALLATAAVHHHLIRKGLRTSVGLVVETGEAREVHHFACLAGYGAEAINPYLAFETLAAMAPGLPEEVERLRGGQALHQVDRQGPAEGHVEDGHFDLPVLLRRADFRRGRPARSDSSTDISPAPRRRSTASASTRSPRRPRAATPTPSATRRSIATRSMSAANTPSASAARRIRWTPQTVSLLQHAVRGNAARQISRLRQAAQRAGRAPADHPRPVPHQGRRGGRPPAGAARRGRAGQGHRQALRDRRHVLRLDFARGAYHARHRDEPHRRQVEHRRRRRGSGPLQADAQRRIRCARRSSRSPPAASA